MCVRQEGWQSLAQVPSKFEDYTKWGEASTYVECVHLLFNVKPISNGAEEDSLCPRVN